MDIFFQVIFDKANGVWTATAFQMPAPGQKPTPVAKASGDEPADALQSCCEQLED